MVFRHACQPCPVSLFGFGVNIAQAGISIIYGELTGGWGVGGIKHHGKDLFLRDSAFQVLDVLRKCRRQLAHRDQVTRVIKEVRC